MKERLKQFLQPRRSLSNVARILLGRDVIPNQIDKTIEGFGNRVEYGAHVAFRNCRLRISGNNNHLVIEDFGVFNNVTFAIMGHDHSIRIGKSVRFNRGGEVWLEDSGCTMTIGAHTTFENAHLAVTEPGSILQIGDDCMFAYDIDVRTGDSHSILDRATGERINYARHVLIEDNVWVAAHCSILKGTVLRKDTVVATRSVVSEAHERGAIVLGGSPARVLREDITWDRKRIYRKRQA